MSVSRRDLLLGGLSFTFSGCTYEISQPEPVQFIAVGGQSNAGLGGADPTREMRPLFPNVLQFANGAKAGLGWVPQWAEDFLSLEAAHDDASPRGQYIATTTGFALGMDGRDYIVRTDWFGGRSIEYFIEGSVHFHNTLQAVRGAKVWAGARPVVCPWYVWIQGESGPNGRDVYAQQLGDYAASIVSAIASELGQAVGPTFAIVQTNTGDVRGDATGNTDYKPGDSVSLAQWDVARTTPGVILAGPMYQAPIIFDPQDNIHANSAGRMIVGEMLAAVMAAGPQWKPLQPVSAVLDYDRIFVRFHLPAGPLTWDRTWIAPARHFGFSYTDDKRSAEISLVTIVSRDTVCIILSNPPTGDHKLIRYAQEAVDHEFDGWSGARGQLISPTQRVSLFWSLGHPVPQTINHYAVKFEMPIYEGNRLSPPQRTDVESNA